MLNRQIWQYKKFYYVIVQRATSSSVSATFSASYSTLNQRPEENYGTVLRDCSKALMINPKSSKAYYRSSIALLALERVDDAIDCCDRCLQIDKDNKSVQSVRERASKAKAAKELKDQERLERIRKEKELNTRLSAAFKASCLGIF